MKKLFLSMMAVAIAACTFTSCEDVPEPYNNPYNYQGTNTKVDPKGDGTLATPFNVAAALAKCEEVGEAGTATEVYATGYITELTEVSTSYGNATFKIADSKDGGDALTVYRAKGFKGENITDENLLHAGDSVVVYGKLVNFKGNTPEFTQGCYLVSINGKSDGGEGGEGGDDPETVGTKEAPKTVAEAIAAINALEANKNTDAKWYIKGKVKTVKTKDADITKYKNIDYTIVDDGATDELTIFRGKYLDNADFTLENKVKEGDEVIVLGNLQKYVKDESSAPVPEVTNNYIVVLNGGGVTPPAPSGDNLIANGDFETWEGNVPTNWNGMAGNATLEKSTDAHTGSAAVLIKTNSANKRLSYKAVTLKAGTYNIAFYAKAVSGTAKIAPGYVAIINGAPDSQNYKYIETYPEVGTSWTAVNHSFTLEAETEVCLVIMKHKSTENDVIIDDYELTTSDGGIADGGDTPPTPPAPGESYFSESFENGQGEFTIEDKVCTGVWTASSYQSDKFMKATSFINKVNNDAENWLISPLIDLTSAQTAVLKFAEVINSYFGTVNDEAMVYAKKEADANWTKLSFTRAEKPSSGYTKFTDATANISIDLASFKGGKMQFAFVYKGSSTASGTWEIKDVSVVPAE